MLNSILFYYSLKFLSTGAKTLQLIDTILKAFRIYYRYNTFTYIGGIVMVDDLKNILLAGLGAAAYTYEKSKKVIDDMVEKGKLTLEEGKELSEELKRNMKEKESKYIPVTKDEMIALFKEMNFATKDDLQDLKTRLAKLEQE